MAHRGTEYTTDRIIEQRETPQIRPLDDRTDNPSLYILCLFVSLIESEFGSSISLLLGGNRRLAGVGMPLIPGNPRIMKSIGRTNSLIDFGSESFQLGSACCNNVRTVCLRYITDQLVPADSGTQTLSFDKRVRTAGFAPELLGEGIATESRANC